MERKSVPFRIVAASILFGVAFGGVLTLTTLRVMGVPLNAGLDSSAFQKFFSAYNDLHNKYVSPQSDQKLLDGAIGGMTNAIGDPFSDYFPPTDAQQFHSMLSGSYVGIGVEIDSTNGQVVIQSVMKDSPAQKAGLKAQDVIVKVDGTSVIGMTMDEVSSHVLGPKGTKVVITVKRPSAGNSELNFTVTRDNVSKATVFPRMLDHGVGYIQISVVGDTTASEVDGALKMLKSEGATRLILDLRGNPGGYLDQAVKIAGDFIPKGKTVVQTQGRTGAAQPITSDGPGSRIPVVVLMDQDTASAAEILSASLHEDNGAPLVGTKSYGKGTVQETESFTDGSALKYTVAKWLTPNGEWIHKKGLTPTYAIELPAFVSIPSIDSTKLPLRQGDNNTDVADIQKMLNALGYAVDRTDGYFDADTARQVRRFQSSSGLASTGVVDQATAGRLQSRLSQLIADSDTQLKKAEAVVLGIPVPQSSS